MKWFVEEKGATASHWMPALYRDRPEVNKHMKIRMTETRVRNHPVEVAPEHYQFPMFELQKIYGGGAHEPA